MHFKLLSVRISFCSVSPKQRCYFFLISIYLFWTVLMIFSFGSDSFIRQ